MNIRFGRQICFQYQEDVRVTKKMGQLRRVRHAKRRGDENVVLSLFTKRRKSMARLW